MAAALPDIPMLHQSRPPELRGRGPIVPSVHWSMLEDGRVQCEMCPRLCRLKEGARGACFVRARENDEMTGWVVEHLGPGVPVHFTAFHPDYRMLDKPRTAFETLAMARRVALRNGVRYAYAGNVHDLGRQSTYCHVCGTRTIGRDWYELSDWRLDDRGACTTCGTPTPGVFDGRPGRWGRKRRPVDFS